MLRAGVWGAVAHIFEKSLLYRGSRSYFRSRSYIKNVAHKLTHQLLTNAKKPPSSSTNPVVGVAVGFVDVCWTISYVCPFYVVKIFTGLLW